MYGETNISIILQIKKKSARVQGTGILIRRIKAILAIYR